MARPKPAKINRSGKSVPIKSRGFDRTVKRKINGKVEKRK